MFGIVQASVFILSEEYNRLNKQLISMRWSFLIFIALLGFSCGEEEEKTIPCDQLLYKLDDQLYFDFDELQRAKYELESTQYIEQLKGLRSQELDLYQQAQQCEFVNPQAHDYWYRGRMKFPSRIEMELNQYE